MGNEGFSTFFPDTLCWDSSFPFIPPQKPESLGHWAGLSLSQHSLGCGRVSSAKNNLIWLLKPRPRRDLKPTAGLYPERRQIAIYVQHKEQREPEYVQPLPTIASRGTDYKEIRKGFLNKLSVMAVRVFSFLLFFHFFRRMDDVLVSRELTSCFSWRWTVKMK